MLLYSILYIENSSWPLLVQDPFTLPSHLIMKDPKEYAEANHYGFGHELIARRCAEATRPGNTLTTAIGRWNWHDVNRFSLMFIDFNRFSLILDVFH